MNTKTTFAIVLGILLCVVFAGIISAESGAIWTTLNDCGDSTQNVNEYAKGENLYINGNGFNANTLYNWSITGSSGNKCDKNIVVASGNYTTDANGAFCFNAYTIALDDCDVYKYNFNGKNDNYHVNENLPIVPEFTGIIAGLTVLGALGTFLIVRKN